MSRTATPRRAGGPAVPTGRDRAAMPGPGRRGARGLLAALVALTVLAVLGGVWGLTRSGEHPDSLLPAGSTRVPGGALVVHGLTDRDVASAMAGMGGMADPVPAGLRRFTVDVTLMASGEAALPHSPADFTVRGAGVEATAPTRSQLGEGVLQPGEGISGGMSFDVPASATAVELSFKGGPPVRLPDLPPPSEGTGHGGHGADAEPGAGQPAGAPPPTQPAQPGSGGDPAHPDDGHGH